MVRMNELIEPDVHDIYLQFMVYFNTIPINKIFATLFVTQNQFFLLIMKYHHTSYIRKLKKKKS
jgi:hypothetical protein